ncbi:sulfide:quinone oxidoreductase, mitochondrial [Ischnura elegans]|uniref:sulfide:quinone oxidoreductase, mitochondrial n=1 Tax=Ischnura elegans TaxID=197161 RepID=UPI001ED87919|nr:sulfide:quinone oxidoreductase, mitochondrial [Ischnura elegans]
MTMWCKGSKLASTTVQENFLRELKRFSTGSVLNKKHSCKLLIVGGGSGGCSVGAKYASKLGKGNVIIIEPSEKHYYQPMFTLIGGGMKTLENSCRPTKSVLPKNAVWLKDYVVKFDPAKNQVMLKGGDTVEYEFMVTAIGLQLNFNAVEGLVDALKTPGVCSNYAPEYVTKTFEDLKKFKEGNAIFTFPNTPVKCAGAPQKIMYIAEHYFRKTGRRDKANIIYNTSLPVIFGVKKYACALNQLCDERGIKVNLRHNLIKVDPAKKEAVFENLDSPGSYMTLDYSLLHVSPPMSAPKVLQDCKELVDSTGFLDVSKDTLLHKKFDNIFGIGDCTNLPTSKTGAAVASQLRTLRLNLDSRMKNEELTAKYLGYTSCPLVTGYNSCILAEFDYNGAPMETFPVDQGKERLSMFMMKKYIMPELYWNLMLRGYWEGPAIFRKIMHLGFR